MYKFYTGVGSRDIPQEFFDYAVSLGRKLAKLGWILRSGGASGADTAFQNGAGKHCTIYLANQATPQAMAIAEKYHPAWSRCGDYVRKLHGRNAFQVLGADLNTPSKFLVCWTIDGAESHRARCYQTGGTGTAISIASENNIPVFNLTNSVSRQRLLNFLRQ